MRKRVFRHHDDDDWRFTGSVFVGFRDRESAKRFMDNKERITFRVRSRGYIFRFDLFCCKRVSFYLPTISG